MPSIPTLVDLFRAGVHFGHRVSRRHPKMEPYIFTQRHNIHVIDLEKTLEKLKQAGEFVKKIVANGGTILFLGTKKQAHDIVMKYAQECRMPYVVEKWIGGTFTNFSEISKRIARYRVLKAQKESGELDKYTKKEQLLFDRELDRLQTMVGGILDLKKIPDAIYIIDVKREKTAVREAMKKEIPIVGICDTNANPQGITYMIPANDDGIKSIELITRFISEAVKEGLQERSDKQNAQKDSS